MVGWFAMLRFESRTFPGLGGSSTTLSRIPGFRLVVLIYLHKYNEEFRIGNVKDEIAHGF